MALDAGVERMLAEAASDLLADCRFRLFTIEAHGSTISAHLFVAAGGQVAYWNGGFDESFAGDQPSMRVLVGAIQDAIGAVGPVAGSGRGKRGLQAAPG